MLDATAFGLAAPQADPRLGAADEYGRVLHFLYPPGTGTPLEGRPSGLVFLPHLLVQFREHLSVPAGVSGVGGISSAR